jgi:hypothetical protein
MTDAVSLQMVGVGQQDQLVIQDLQDRLVQQDLKDLLQQFQDQLDRPDQQVLQVAIQDRPDQQVLRVHLAVILDLRGQRVQRVRLDQLVLLDQLDRLD